MSFDWLEGPDSDSETRERVIAGMQTALRGLSAKDKIFALMSGTITVAQMEGIDPHELVYVFVRYVAATMGSPIENLPTPPDERAN